LFDFGFLVMVIGAFFILFYIIITMTPKLREALNEHPAIAEVLRLLKSKIKSIFFSEES